MSVLGKFFNNKAQQNSAQNVDLYQPVSGLFQAYLINTCSKNIDKGGSPYDVSFTSMAKTSQPYTFSQFCAYVQQGFDISSQSKFNLENMQLVGAQNVLNNPQYNQGTFGSVDKQTSLVEACNIVSAVYEMGLATSARFQQSSMTPEKDELSYSTLLQLKNNFDSNPAKAFTSQPFDREQPDYTVVRTIENPRQDYIELANNGYAEYVGEALNLIVDTTAKTQNTMAIMHKDFECQTPGVEG